MTLSDAALREIAKVFRKHVDQKTLEKVVDDLLEIRGDKSFRDMIGTLARELKARSEELLGLLPEHDDQPRAQKEERAPPDQRHRRASCLRAGCDDARQ
jgi:hypothetical protein